MSAVPQQPKLYQQVVNEAKRKFKVWPSAYASGWVVRTYKNRGGTYSGNRDTDKKNNDLKRPVGSGGIDRWFREKWIDVCVYLKEGKKVPCGREHGTSASHKNGSYPYCRPSKRVSEETPSTIKEVDRAELLRRCREKKKDPSSRVLGKGSKK
jgi:hypothetical protein